MINQIRLRNYKGITNIHLTDLKKVNVISGRNNSGKSSILEACSKENHRIFYNLDYDQSLDRIYNATFRAFPWIEQYTSATHPVNMLYRNFLTKRFSTLNDFLMFNDELNNSSDQILRDLSGYMRGHTNNLSLSHIKILTNEIPRLYESSLTTQFIPAKRKLLTKSSLGNASSFSASGEGVISRLFHAKNQGELSKDLELLKKTQFHFKNISDGFEFDIILTNEHQLELVCKSPYLENWLPADQSGLGLNDLILILFTTIFSDEKELFLIEEPELHLHPDMQRKLADYFHREVKNQIILSTHSNVFLNLNFVNKIYHSKFESSVVISDQTTKANLLQDLGYSIFDNLISDLIVLVEGPTDIPVYEEFLLKMDILGKYSIKFLPLGGDIMTQIDLSVFTDIKNVFAIIDKDPKSKKIRDQFKINCESNGIPIKQLKRYSVENYFTLNAIRSIFGSQIPENIDKLNPNMKIEDQLGINVKKSNRKIAKLMDISDIKDTDLYETLSEIKKVIMQ
ncbi:ATP-dependent nuclease [Leptospira terpstrae]|uniref:ATP-dependent nuclease n=1 Tax=Leptospira terpstrae TaxID=293075 RepID=UPI003D090B62